MNKVISKIQSNPILATVAILLVGIFVFFSAKYLQDLTINIFDSLADLNFYRSNVIFKTYMLILSVVMILLLNKGKLANYGFKLTKNINYFKLGAITIGITLLSMIVGGIVFMGILNNIFPTGNSAGFPESNTFLERVLTVWIWSSICEEVLFRGLIQGFIQKFSSKKFLRLSFPVIFSGLAFGAMHLSLISAGMGQWFVCFVLVFTSTIGILAAYYREKSDSIIPAIYIHIMGNVAGSLPLIVKMIVE